MKRQPASLRQKRVKKFGTVAFVSGALLLAVLTVLNLLAAALPAKVTRFDASGKGLVTMSAESRRVVSDLNEEVTIYWVCEDGIIDNEYTGDWFALLLTRFDEASDRVTVKRVDTNADTAFAEKYGTEGYNNHSIIVESARRHTVVDAADYYRYSNAYVNSLAGGEYIMTIDEFENMRNYIYYAYQGVDIARYQTYQHSVADAKITSAIDYVTRETVPHGYLLTGYAGETPTETMLEYLAGMTDTLDTLDISAATSVPSDANCVVLYAPTADLNGEQTAVLRAYLDRGGSLIMATSPNTVQSCPNILSLAADFGLSAAPGLVADSKQGYHASDASIDVLTPTINQNHDIYLLYENYKIVPRMPQSHAIAAADTLPDGVTVTPLLTTSDQATRLEIGNVSNSLCDKGKQNVAMTATRTVTTADGTATTAELTWFGSVDAFNAETAETTEEGNYFYFAVAFADISKDFASTYENIAAVLLTPSMLEPIHTAVAITLMVTLTLVIPLGLLTTGIVVWQKRKRRR